MALLVTDRNDDRFKAGLGVVACHLLMGYALVTGFHYEVVRSVGESLKLIDVRAEPPPPEQKTTPAPAARTPEGAAAPPSLKAAPTPIVLPPPRIRLPLPPPLPTIDKPTRLPTGSDGSAGRTATPGTGSGTGGEGSGTGSGGQGSGSGGGGAARAERLSGEISGARDYPRSARRAGIEGSVRVRFTVRADGSARDCRVTRSSGDSELDSTTCRLIEQRFRYRPARDPQGNPVPEVVSRTFDWLLPARSRS
jgi:protein TonB